MPQKPRRLKTPMQLWVADQRKAHSEVPADLARLTGVTVDTARAWESRGKPSEDAIRILERHWDSAAPTEAGADTGDTQSVPAAYLERIDSLVALVNRLVDELAATRGINSPLTPAEKAGLFVAGVEGEPQPPTPSSPRPLGRLPSGGTPRKGSRATASTEVPQ